MRNMNGEREMVTKIIQSQERRCRVSHDDDVQTAPKYGLENDWTQILTWIGIDPRQ